jgi:hypothetical protein
LPTGIDHAPPGYLLSIVCKTPPLRGAEVNPLLDFLFAGSQSVFTVVILRGRGGSSSVTGIPVNNLDPFERKKL